MVCLVTTGMPHTACNSLPGIRTEPLAHAVQLHHRRQGSLYTWVARRPICSFYTTNMAVSAQGAVLMGSTAAVALVCSQPVFGLTKSLLNVTLTPAASQNEVTVGLLPTVIAQVQST